MCNVLFFFTSIKRSTAEHTSEILLIPNYISQCHLKWVDEEMSYIDATESVNHRTKLLPSLISQLVCRDIVLPTDFVEIVLTAKCLQEIA